MSGHRISGSAATVLIAVAAFLILVFIIAPKGCGCTSGAKAKITAAKMQIGNSSSALDAFHSDCGRFPATTEGLAALLTNPGVVNWKGPYLRGEIPLDPWNNPYQYQLRELKYRLASFGPDGADRTNDDISNEAFVDREP